MNKDEKKDKEFYEDVATIRSRIGWILALIVMAIFILIIGGCVNFMSSLG